MPEKTKKFHDFALSSALFKGRSQYYFCYLKSERVAHTLAYLGQHSIPGTASIWKDVLGKAQKVTDGIIYFCAGSMHRSEALGNIFSLISILRSVMMQGLLSEENGLLIIAECEGIAERLEEERTPLLVSPEQFAVPFFTGEEMPVLPGKTESPVSLYKGHSKGHAVSAHSTLPSQTDRTAKILNFIKSKKGVSIKEISNIVRNCSEKTIQRELVQLIKEGSVKKVGERRWSIYLPTTQ